MRSNSDGSDYEDEAFDTVHFAQVSNASMKNFSIDKQQTLDSNDNDYDGKYFRKFVRQGNEKKFRSEDVSADLSGDQDSNDEYTDQDIQFEKTNNLPSTCHDQDSSDEDNEDHFDQQKIFIETEYNIKHEEDDLNYTDPKFEKRKYDSASNSEERYSKRLKKDNSESSIDSFKDKNCKLPQPKQLNTANASNILNGEDKIRRIMRKMGYNEGDGLGKNKQGRLEPVEASKQHGRRGLGHHIPELEDASFQWDPLEEEIKVKENMTWLNNVNTDVPSLEEMHSWLMLGPKKSTIDDETNFCSPDVVASVVKSKTVFDRLDKTEMRRARTRCNPFETIRKAFFLNRAAVKMANMDKACDFMFTKPDDLKSNELLYFADVCAGPGGFSEYVLWRKKWHAKGFGFTLKNENDFALDDFYAGPTETFHPYYGPEGDGDVFKPCNQDAFHNLIMQHTHGIGVHFMMSDGGFSVEGQENIQEILSKQLYLCQCLVALMIVRTNGNFVTKLFDIFTPFSVGLIYLMYRCFEQICIFKPNSSRPANSERYLICKRKRPNVDDVIDYLKHVNHLLLKGEDNNDVIHLVSFEVLESDKQFFDYIRETNEYLGRKQITSLCKIAAFCENSALIEPKQADMRKQCLEYWELPDESRTVPRYSKPEDRIRSLLQNSTAFLLKKPTTLTLNNMGNTVLNMPYDWFCIPCSSNSSTYPEKMATFYLGMGKTRVFRYYRGNWVLVSDYIKVELPPDTLVYAEEVQETIKAGKQIRKVLALHILDAYMLGAEDISKKYLTDRNDLIRKLCEALWKPSGHTYTCIRAKELIPVGPDIEKKLNIQRRTMKNNSQALTYEIPKKFLNSYNSTHDVPYFAPSSIFFLKSTAFPWQRSFSKTYSATYVFNTKTRMTHYDKHRPPAAEASFIETYENCMIWNWPADESLTMEKLTQDIFKKYPHTDVSL